MSQDVLRSLFEKMCDEGVKHFDKTRPIMKLTEAGYVDTGQTEPVWEAKDVSAFTGLLKLAEYKHVEGISNSPAELRDDLAQKRNKRNASRQAAAERSAIPPIKIEV